jgi:hypothetical protein
MHEDGHSEMTYVRNDTNDDTKYMLLILLPCYLCKYYDKLDVLRRSWKVGVSAHSLAVLFKQSHLKWKRIWVLERMHDPNLIGMVIQLALGCWIGA